MIAQTARLTTFTAPWSLAGLPVIAIPCGEGEGGLPVSLQLVGSRGMESALFDLAGTFEHATKTRSDPSMTAAKLCAKSFHTGSVRDVPESEKKQVYAEYNVTCTPGKAHGGTVSCSTMEIDHLISLELGGDNSANNLWPQSYCGGNNAHIKDKLENKLHSQICSNKITIKEAQECIASNWVICYNKTFK
jgi:5-methylcytosine-specific restriction endonuclease McrA